MSTEALSNEDLESIASTTLSDSTVFTTKDGVRVEGEDYTLYVNFSSKRIEYSGNKGFDNADLLKDAYSETTPDNWDVENLKASSFRDERQRILL